MLRNKHFFLRNCALMGMLRLEQLKSHFNDLLLSSLELDKQSSICCSVSTYIHFRLKSAVHSHSGPSLKLIDSAYLAP